MKKTDFYPITCWCGVPAKYVRDENGNIAVDRLIEMKESGINVILAFYDKQTNIEVLKEAEKLNLLVTLGDGRIDKALYDAENRETLLRAVAEDYRDYPALLGYHIVDEPNSAGFAMLAEIRGILAKYDNEHEAYINLFPNYASPEQLGNPTYYAHVEQFINDVKPEIVSYDHYHFIKGAKREKIEFKDERERKIYEDAFSGGSEYEAVDRVGFFTNVDEIRELSLKYGIPFMVIILVVEHGPYRNLTEAELRWEVWQSLAYGSERISYFTYWTPGVDRDEGDDFWHWQNGMITKDGKKTAHYHIIADINKELSAVGGELMGRKSQAVFHIGEMPGEKLTYWQGSYGCVDRIDGDKLTLGFFDGDYLLIANRDYTKESELTLATAATVEIFEPENGEWVSVDAGSHEYSVVIDAGDAVLVRMIKKLF